MGWSVYRHTFPTGETYIGITGGDVESRWNNGFGYETQRTFFKQIVKVGWDNIKHEILASGLDEKQAREMERELIAKERDNTYNTQHRKGMDLAWIHKPICRDTPQDRVRKFRKLNDDWMDKVRHFDTIPLDWEIGDDHIDFRYYVWSDEGAMSDVIRVPISRDITYSELYTYLRWKLDFDKCKIIKSEQFDTSSCTWYNRVAEVG